MPKAERKKCTSRKEPACKLKQRPGTQHLWQATAAALLLRATAQCRRQGSRRTREEQELVNAGSIKRDRDLRTHHSTRMRSRIRRGSSKEPLAHAATASAAATAGALASAAAALPYHLPHLFMTRRLVGVSRRNWTLGQPGQSGNMRIKAHKHTHTYAHKMSLHGIRRSSSSM